MHRMRMLAHHTLNFRNRYDWKVTAKQQEQREKQAKTADQHGQVNIGRRKIAPTGWQKIPAERRNANYKPLEPHTYIHEDRHDPHQYRIRSKLLKPKQLR